MTTDAYKHAIAELEKYVGRPFHADKETRSNLLNKAYREIKELDDAALLNAVEGLMLSLRPGLLPSLQELIDTVKRCQAKRNADMTKAIEADADQYRREAVQHRNILTDPPPSGMIADAIKAHVIFASGKCTWREYLQMQTALHKKYPSCGFDTAQAELVRRLNNKGADLDAYNKMGGYYVTNATTTAARSTD